jgi:hypothetical protein
VTANEIMFRVVDALERANVPHMLVGSYSSNAYGIPRSTQDADFVIELGSNSPDVLADLLRPDLRIDPQLHFETVTGSPRYIATHAASGFTVELFLLTDDPHNRERFARRHRVEIYGRPLWLPTAEDVVVQKLRWYVRAKRSKDIDDVRNVLAVQKGRLDLPYVRAWCDQHGSRAILEDLLAQVEQL